MMFQKNLFLLFSCFFFISCHSIHRDWHHSKKGYSKPFCGKCKHGGSISGKAQITALEAKGPKGFVMFEKIPHQRGQVKVKAEITNLKPNQKFGFHVHEFGGLFRQRLKGRRTFNSNYHKKRFFKKNKHSEHGRTFKSQQTLRRFRKSVFRLQRE